MVINLSNYFELKLKGLSLRKPAKCWPKDFSVLSSKEKLAFTIQLFTIITNDVIYFVKSVIP